MPAPPLLTDEIANAAGVLRAGGLVAFPTETVYGLGADAARDDAVARIYAVKRRPTHHPLIVHVARADDVSAWVRDRPAPARALADAFWPGPLTLVCARAARVSDAVTGGLDTIALRVPDHPVALALLRTFGGGVAAPSANRFGSVSPTTAAHVRRDLGTDVPCVLDGGPCRVGVESTIVDVSTGQARLLRPGGVTREAIERVLGAALPWGTDPNVRAPGLLPSHYAPAARVRLVPANALVDEANAAATRGERVAVLVPAPAPSGLDRAVTVIELPADVEAEAHALYAALRQVDDAGATIAFTSPPPEDGLGLAVADRLRRAAGPREP